jgi:hypothetical protein
MKLQGLPKSSGVQHLFDTQSVFALHLLLFAHLGQFVPPQSTSVSPLFSLPSVQLTHVPLSHAPLAQSVPVLHDLPSAQSPQSSVVPQPSVG